MNLINSLKYGLIEDLCLDDKNFRNILWQCAILGLLIFLSIFWMPFVYLALICGTFFICLQKDGNQLYFLIFLLPLISIFKTSENDLYILAYLCALVIINLGIRFLIAVIKKEKKINIPFTISTALFIVFILIFANYSALSFIFSLILGIALIYISYVYKSDLNFKKIVLLFTFGLIFSVFIGLFRPISSRLESLSIIFYDYGKPRFSGASSNPNILGGELVVCLACIMALYCNKEFKVVFWPVFTIFLISIIFVLSKATFLIFAVIMLLFITIYLIKNHSKVDWLKIGIIVLLTICILFIFYFRFKFLIQRLTDPIQTSTSVQNGKPTTNTQINMSMLSTGRTELWLQYLKESFSSAKFALVGHGVGADFIGAYSNSVGFGPHNTFIQILYYTGISGYIFIFAMTLSVFDFKKIKQIKLHNLITFIALGLYLFAIEFFSFRLSIYLLLVLPALFYSPTTNQSIDATKTIMNNERIETKK